jgi:hypothetical protein
MSDNALTDVMSRFSAQGWDGLEIDPEALPRQMRQMRQEAAAEASPVAALFSTPEGLRVLDWLVAKTLLRSPSDAELHATSLEAYALAKARREGQNGVVLMIIEAIQTVRHERDGAKS